MACICQGAAIYVLAIGAFRTWRSQNAMIRGKAISGGLEIVFLAAGVFLVSTCVILKLLFSVLMPFSDYLGLLCPADLSGRRERRCVT
jgi:uncharacterized membrane protein YidH (DUF202 family)